jgi:Predicted amino acid aldolase or racemase
MTLSALPTPALLIEQSRLQANLATMQAQADANDVALRPHTKTHKSVALANEQRNRGAEGLTVATVKEAETFIDAGFDDVRVAYPVTGRNKHERLRALRADSKISFTVDTVAGADQASAVYAEADIPVDVLIEVDVGHGRCGVHWADDAAAVTLARRIASLPGLTLAGILTHAGQAYSGPSNGETEADALRRASRQERDRMLSVASALAEADGVNVTPDNFEISVGSTPSMAAFTNATRDGFRVTEIRPGNYVMHDAMQVPWRRDARRLRPHGAYDRRQHAAKTRRHRPRVRGRGQEGVHDGHRLRHGRARHRPGRCRADAPSPEPPRRSSLGGARVAHDDR